MKQITFQKNHNKQVLFYYIVFTLMIIYVSKVFEVMKDTPVTPYNGYIMNFQGEKIKVSEVKAEAVPTVTPEPRNWRPYEELTYKIFGEEDGKIAYAIQGCESNYKPDREHIDERESSIGLMQINLAKGNGEGARVHWDKVPGENLEEKVEWLKIPENNLLIAKFIKGSSNWYPWTCFTKKGYLKYF